jgi:quercetin dioxygenase-like cupin family protein
MADDASGASAETPRLLHWTEVETLPPLAGFVRRAICGEGAMLMRVQIEAGRELPAHSHPNEQFTIMLRGRLAFTIGQDDQAAEFEARAGDVVHVRGGLVHSARAIDDVVEIDVFAPPRPDLLP